jgi:serpin B
MRPLLALCALSVACSACTAPEIPVRPAADAAAPPASTTTAVTGPSTGATAVATPPAGQPTSLAKSNNALAIDLYKQIRGASGNVAFSPLSIGAALAMVWAGARGETAAQMKTVLHGGGAAPAMVDAESKLAASYRDPAKKVTVRIANRLFGEKTFAFDRGFLDLTAAAGGPLQGVDFKGAAEPSRALINGWVANETNDLIKDLLAPSSLDAHTRLVVANAIYFHGNWEQPFAVKGTTPAPFNVTATSTKDVPTMYQWGRFGFVARDGVKVLQMPYQGGELAMTVVLPDAADGLDAVEKQLTPAALDGWISGLQTGMIDVALPRFKVDPPQATDLAGTLSALGMPLAFDRDKADLSGIAAPGSERLHVSKVFHKAFVNVDETGTEAAAATGVGVAEASAMPAQPAVFHADHPFVFMVRDVRSGVILFMGRVSDPAL